MANRERGQVNLEVDGRTYTLVLTLNAMCEVEDALSTPEQDVVFNDLLKRLPKQKMKDFRLFIWACLREHHVEMTVADAGTLVQQVGGVAAFNRRIAALLASASPDPEDLKDAGVSPETRPRKAQLVAGGTGADLNSRHSASA